jgi:hypothetical protein
LHLVHSALFSLTPALSRWEREAVTARSWQGKLVGFVVAFSEIDGVNGRDAFSGREPGVRFSLSQRERAGVRENTTLPKTGCKKSRCVQL